MHHQKLAFPLIASLVLCAGWTISACSSTSTAAIGPAGDAGNDATQPTGDDAGPASDDGGGTTPDGSVTLAKACGDWAQARCTRLDSCSNATYTVVHYGSQATCVTNSTAQCTTDLAASQTAATPSYFEGCANAMTTESCSDLFNANPPAACTPLAGPGAVGATCFVAAQCQSTYCAVAQFATCGTCAAVPKSGDACVVDADCGSRNQLTCSKAGTCVAYGASGGSCDKDDPCGSGLTCVGAKPLKAIAGSCMPSGSTVGATCDASEETAAGCDAELSLACDPATSLCIAEALVGANATCGLFVDGGLSRCESAGTCLIPTSDAGTDDDAGDSGAAPVANTTPGSCVAAAANGAACNSTSTPGCIPPAKCVIADGGADQGTCQLDDPTSCL